MYRRLVRTGTTWFAVASTIAMTGCASANDRARSSSVPTSQAEANRGRRPSSESSGDVEQTGLATWYGDAFAGRKTANGERFDPSKLTAAHRTLPFGTWVEVRRVDSGKTVRVRITDRGPFGGHGRIIDLSKKAADQIDMIRDGVTKVELRIVGGP